MYTPDVWDRNLTSLIRSGAFNEKRSVEPMSVYKWTKLIDYFEEEGIIDVFSDGASLHYYDEEFNLPVVLRDRVVQLLKSDPPQSLSERYSVGRTVMNNAKLNDRLNDIFQKEHASNEIHWETLQLLAVIIHTLHSLLEGRYGLRGLLDIGCLLRNDGDRIDYVRLKSYLKRLELTRFSRLAGRFLISVLGFKKEEVPFAGKIHTSDTSTFYKMVVHPSSSKGTLLLLSPREVYATLHGRKETDSEVEANSL